MDRCDTIFVTVGQFVWAYSRVMLVNIQCYIRADRWTRTRPNNIPILLVEFAIILMRMTLRYDPNHKIFGNLGEKGSRVPGERVERGDAIYGSISEQQGYICGKD